MTIKEQLQRKLEIRSEVRANLGEKEGSLFVADKTKRVEQSEPKTLNQEVLDPKIHSQLRSLEQHIRQVQSFAVQSEYWELKSERKIIGPIIIFFKKAMRKIFYKVFGWYINRILYQQTQYNQGGYSALKNIDNILGIQTEEIIHLKQYICELEQANRQMGEDLGRLVEEFKQQKEGLEQQREELEQQREELQLQRDEYTIMIRYYDK